MLAVESSFSSCNCRQWCRRDNSSSHDSPSLSKVPFICFPFLLILKSTLSLFFSCALSQQVICSYILLYVYSTWSGSRWIVRSSLLWQSGYNSCVCQRLWVNRKNLKPDAEMSFQFCVVLLCLSPVANGVSPTSEYTRIQSAVIIGVNVCVYKNNTEFE